VDDCHVARAGVGTQSAQRRQARFMALVAHEVRNPPVPIQIAANVLTGRRLTGGHRPDERRGCRL